LALRFHEHRTDIGLRHPLDLRNVLLYCEIPERCVGNGSTRGEKQAKNN
jgi:hypothetical protein